MIMKKDKATRKLMDFEPEECSPLREIIDVLSVLVLTTLFVYFIIKIANLLYA